MSIFITGNSRDIQIIKSGITTYIPKKSAIVFTSGTEVGISYYGTGFSTTNEIIVLTYNAITSQTFSNSSAAAIYLQDLIDSDQKYSNSIMSFSGISVTGLSNSFVQNLSAGTLSANTLYSGTTNLYNIFSPLNSVSQISVRPGLNTYTGGTSTNPTVNISAATLNNITITGITSLVSASTTYLQVNTTSASTISRERVIVYDEQMSSFSNVFVGIASAQTYAQLNIRNIHGGNQASSDIIATADNGTETSNYIDMGINSSTFSGYVGAANDGYLYSTGNDLLIGNITPGKSVKLFTDGTGNTNIRVTITSASTNINNLSATTISADTIFLSGTNLSNYLHNNVDYYNAAGTITGNGGSFGQTAHRWYSNGVNAITTVALTASSLKAVPIFISRSQIWDKIGFEVTAGGSGTTNYLSAALYSSVNGFPTNKIYQFGTASTNSNSRIIISGDTPTILPGLYFVAFNHSNINSLTYRGYNTTTGGGVQLGFDNNNFSSPMLSWSCTNTVSANLPSVFSGATVATVANAPAIFYHIKNFV